MSLWQITLKWVAENQQLRNVLHYRGISDSDPSWPDIAQEFGAAFATSLAARYTPGTGLLGINVLELEPGKVSLDFPISTTGIFGTDSDEPLPPQLCGLITLNGALPSKPNRGRIYMPAPNRDNLTAGSRWGTDMLNAWNAWMEDIVQLDDTEGATFQQVIYSRTYPKEGTLLYNDVVSWTLRGIPGTQRKRREGVGT